MASAASVQVHPGRGVGSLVLGVSVRDILIHLKAHPHLYPKIELLYSPSQPVEAPVSLDLPRNGLRLRFDGPDQRLRLIEVLDFSKTRLGYRSKEVVKVQDATPLSAAMTAPTGPSFRHVYQNLLGPTFPGEYHPPAVDDGSAKGTYVLSYPGIAFDFPLSASAWSPHVDFFSLLSSSATSPASSMAVFDGESWPQARASLFVKTPPNPRSLALAVAGKNREGLPDEVELARIHGEGRVELIRRSGNPYWISLSETTPQELVTDLGPPDAIYRKNDRRLSIHRARAIRDASVDSASGGFQSGEDDLTDTDRSSNQTETDLSDDDDHSGGSADARELAPEECFFNYYHHGFDVFISQPTTVSAKLPTSPRQNSVRRAGRTAAVSSNHLTATKIVFHGNVPGSYPFNRHRRIRWTLEHVPVDQNVDTLHSEMSFQEISGRLREVFKGTYQSEDEETSQQRGMVLNRGWGDSPGSSCELLGGWEEGALGKRRELDLASGPGDHGLGNTELFGFPGMVFEVLKSGAVGALTIF